MDITVQSSLSKLVAHLPEGRGINLREVNVTGVCLDSREITPGDIFIASYGTQADGHEFIDQAVEKGAAAAVGSNPVDQYADLKVPYLCVPHPRAAAARLSAALYGFPGKKMTVIGVTGTDGKTTTTNLIHHILTAAGYQAGMISTVEVVIGEETLETGLHVTTPASPDVQGYLARMVNRGMSHVVIEATSHGLAQHRVDECAFDVAVFTNITHEHLDFHGTYQAYREAKARLLTLTGEGQTGAEPQGAYAILNRDDEPYPFLLSVAEGQGLTVVDYGMGGEGEYRGHAVQESPSGVNFQVAGMDGGGTFTSPLIGSYNVYNALASIAACHGALGVGVGDLRRAISRFAGIPGRMEAIEMGQDFAVMVDFAHTPNALRQALITAKKITSGRVIAVFGSAGLRDRAKRRMMAEISAQLADRTVLTAEDPRTESLGDILGEMAAGMRSVGGVEGENFWRVPDRGQAIRDAVDMAQADDLVIICGKGHEQSMCFGETEYPWDDRVAARAALADLLGVEGPTMPCLPTQDEPRKR